MLGDRYWPVYSWTGSCFIFMQPTCCYYGIYSILQYWNVTRPLDVDPSCSWRRGKNLIPMRSTLNQAYSYSTADCICLKYVIIWELHHVFRFLFRKTFMIKIYHLIITKKQYTILKHCFFLFYWQYIQMYIEFWFMRRGYILGGVNGVKGSQTRNEPVQWTTSMDGGTIHHRQGPKIFAFSYFCNMKKLQEKKWP